jgi:hypothetical protein
MAAAAMVAAGVAAGMEEVAAGMEEVADGTVAMVVVDGGGVVAGVLGMVAGDLAGPSSSASECPMPIQCPILYMRPCTRRPRHPSMSRRPCITFITLSTT